MLSLVPNILITALQTNIRKKERFLECKMKIYNITQWGRRVIWEKHRWQRKMELSQAGPKVPRLTGLRTSSSTIITAADTYWSSLCTRPCPECLTRMISCTPHNNPGGEVLLSPPPYGWGKWGSDIKECSRSCSWVPCVLAVNPFFK